LSTDGSEVRAASIIPDDVQYIPDDNSELQVTHSKVSIQTIQGPKTLAPSATTSHLAADIKHLLAHYHYCLLFLSSCANKGHHNAIRLYIGLHLHLQI
jgi:hypothetical protein